MTFTALLTKELRLRLRRERTVWVIVIYLLVMGLLGFTYLERDSAFSGGYQGYLLSQIGTNLYTLLAFVQLFLIVFIVPAFTSTAINGEKERQTFDLLLCSKLSAFSLLAGKLVAGIANALLLIAASIPLFSLVFFFGGVAPIEVLKALLVFVVTAIVTGMFSLFCSTIVRRPPVSTAIAYAFCVLWMFAPWVAFLLSLGGGYYGNARWLILIQSLSVWNPISALMSTLANGPSGIGLYLLPLPTPNLIISPLKTYILLSLLITIILFLLSMVLVKPNPLGRLRSWFRSLKKRFTPSKKGTVTA
ncbi:MAG TPA: ABC transporter permease subunit [Ktedonobacteraceae bacterium]|nr:ABC transporter permease subunit [Ktedonobacteraceae bacterium]